MHKLKKYFQNHWKWIAISILLGQFCAFWILPEIFKNTLVKLIFIQEPSPILLLFAISSFLIPFLIYKPAFFFYIRYKNNFKLREIPFTYMDGIFFFLSSLIFTIAIYNKNIFNTINPSKVIKIWLIAYSIALFLLYVVIKYKSKKFLNLFPPEHVKPVGADFFPDEPITNESEDLLDRKQFVEVLYNQISKYPFSDSFVFGLYGAWGEGKTSVLNLLRSKLKKDENIISFEFDPWYFLSQDTLIKGFYDKLYISLNEKFFLPNIKKFFNRYQKILSSLKISVIDVNLRLGEQPVEGLRKTIQRSILLTEKKIVILIDDIDRLHNKNDILQIFNIVKLSGSFENTIFVLSIDPAKTSSYLKDVISVDPAFLNKIIQSPIHLPSIEQTMIDRFLFHSGHPDQSHFSAFDSLFQKLGIGQERIEAFRNDFNDLYQTQIKRLFPTLREAKRYLNGLSTTLPTIKNEINLFDFLVLELIRIFYPNVYNDIWENPWYYIPSTWSHTTYLTWPYFNKEEKSKKIEEHINKIIQNENKSGVLLELLKTIFFVEIKDAFGKKFTDYSGSANKYRDEKRITHPDVFQKYFMLKVPSLELPDEA